jgi:hypothetical protein
MMCSSGEDMASEDYLQWRSEVDDNLLQMHQQPSATSFPKIRMIETEKTRPVRSIEEGCLESQASNSEPLFSVKSF